MPENVPLTTSSLDSSVGRRPNPWWVAVICSMTSWIDSGIATAFATVLVIYQGAVGLRPDEVGLLTGLYGTGIAVGALVGGRLGDTLGRRRVFTSTMVVIIVGVAILMFSSAFPVLVVGALVLGIGCGADIPVALTTMTEAARTDRQRGVMIALGGVFVALGGISTAIVGGVVGDMGLVGAQILLGQLGALTIVVLLLRLTIPESSKWLISKEESRRGIDTVRADRSSIKDLFSAQYRVPFIALMVFYVLITAAAVPTTAYATYMLHNVAGVSITQASVTGLLAIPVSLVGIALQFVELGNRRLRFPFFTAGGIIAVLAPLIPVVLGFSLGTYIFFFLPSAIGAALAGEGIMRFWAARAFPTLLRNTALGVITSVGRFGAAGFSIAVPVLLAAGINIVLVLIAVFFLVGVSTAWVVFRVRDKHSEFDTEGELDAISATPASA